MAGEVVRCWNLRSKELGDDEKEEVEVVVVGLVDANDTGLFWPSEIRVIKSRIWRSSS